MPVIQSWAKTDIGRKRKHNEDSVLADPQLGLFVVADGMGGHNAGDVASRLATASLKNFYEATLEGVVECAQIFVRSDGMRPSTITDPLRRADRRVVLPYVRSLDRGEVPRGGTLIDLLVSFDDAWRRRVLVTVNGLDIPVLSKEDFVTNKRLVDRPKDRADLALLAEAEGRDRE